MAYQRGFFVVQANEPLLKERSERMLNLALHRGLGIPDIDSLIG